MTHSPLPVGAEIAGRYRIAGPIGQGGMGVVYEAWDGNKLRALKIMDPALVQDPDRRARFDREAHIGSTLRGPHVTEVLDHGVDAATGMPFIVMERLRGQELGALVAQRGRLPVREVRQLLSELCEALATAHAAGVVHRDLKPNNVFVTESGSVKVLDFGIAKVLAEWRTTNSIVVGTPGWMSPEQLDAGGKVAASADVWAIGLLAFFMLTGKEYWIAANSTRDSWAAVFKEICINPIAPATLRAAEYGVVDVLPPGFDMWFSQCVHRTPAARFANAAVAFAALDPLLKIKLVKTPSPSSVGPAQVAATRLPSSPGLSPVAGVLPATVFTPPILDPEAEETLALAHAASELRSRVQGALDEMARDSAPRISSPQASSSTPVTARATPAPAPPWPTPQSAPAGTFVAYRPNAPPVIAALPPTTPNGPASAADPDVVVVRQDRAKRRLTMILGLVAAGLALIIAVVASRGESGSSDDQVTPVTTFTGRPNDTATLRPEDGASPGNRVVMIANAQSKPSQLVVSGGRAYWVNADGAAVMSARVGGGSAETVVGGQSGVGSLAVDGDTVFWQSNDVLYRKGPGDVGRVVLFSTPGIHGIAVAGDEVFWSIEGTPGAIYKGSIGGGTPIPIATGLPQPRDLTVDGESVYWTNGGGSVQKAPRSGGLTITLAAGQPSPHGIALDSTHVYWTNEGTGGGAGSVARVSKLGGTPVTIAESQQVSFAIAVDEGFVYWTGSAGGLRKIDKGSE